MINLMGAVQIAALAEGLQGQQPRAAGGGGHILVCRGC
jgi:hypothetical protein